MRYDLANGRNASRRRVQLLPGSKLTWDKKGRFLATVVVADDNLHFMPCSGLICDGKDLGEFPWAGGDDDMHCTL